MSLRPVGIVIVAQHVERARRTLEAVGRDYPRVPCAFVDDRMMVDDLSRLLDFCRDGWAGNTEAGVENHSPGANGTKRKAKRLGEVELAGTDGTARDILILDGRTVLFQPGWLDIVRDFARRHLEAGLIGCRLAAMDGALLSAGALDLPDLEVPVLIGNLEVDVGQYASTRQVEAVPFECVYIKREVLDSLAVSGLPRPAADSEYCRAARAAGFKILVCGDVTLVLEGDASAEPGPRNQPALDDRPSAGAAAKYDRELLWQSILGVPSGYAMTSRKIMTALDSAGVRVAYRYVYGPGTIAPNEEPDHLGDPLMNLFRRREHAEPPEVSVVFAQGDVFERNVGRYRIGFTMLEVDGFPAEWVRQANRMDEVWVPSEFNREGFLNSGLKRPIHCIPLGVDTNYFNPGISRQPNAMGDFVFFSSFEWGERKDPWTLMKVFNSVFTADEPVRLVCKVMNRDPRVRVPAEVAAMDLDNGGGRITLICNREIPPAQLGMLYRSVDCYVTASRGEGWDLPLMEAMACGLPTIATDWGAHREFVHAAVSYVLQVPRTVPAVALSPYYQGFSWADPDPDHLRFLLRHVYEHVDEARALGRNAAREVEAKWSWRNSALRIKDRLNVLAG